MNRMKSATMNKAKVILTSAVISTLMAASAFAGTWTRTYTSPDGESETYSTLWCYIKDDGTYAQNEWVQDADGTWYWVEYDCTLPITSGISADGFLYDSDGRYIPMEGRFFPTVEQASAVTVGMSYDKVLAILGQEHVRSDNHIVFTNEGITSHAVCTWFFGANGKYRLEFVNGAVSDIYGYLY